MNEFQYDSIIALMLWDLTPKKNKKKSYKKLNKNKWNTIVRNESLYY